MKSIEGKKDINSVFTCQQLLAVIREFFEFV